MNLLRSKAATLELAQQRLAEALAEDVLAEDLEGDKDPECREFILYDLNSLLQELGDGPGAEVTPDLLDDPLRFVSHLEHCLDIPVQTLGATHFKALEDWVDEWVPSEKMRRERCWASKGRFLLGKARIWRGDEDCEPVAAPQGLAHKMKAWLKLVIPWLRLRIRSVTSHAVALLSKPKKNPIAFALVATGLAALFPPWIRVDAFSPVREDVGFGFLLDPPRVSWDSIARLNFERLFVELLCIWAFAGALWLYGRRRQDRPNG